ncbi:MAG TPA: pyridoxamine 5'-phosphate oxidase family protein [Candidatus Saccharimonadales bacterium]|nr:pyridoxamine 5'-phosphate oxidase family protein [Candidatus Saccharimonadales bacterium]
MDHTKNKAKLSERQLRIFNFIDHNRAGVLASVDPNGEPHAAVVYHSINKQDFCVSFLTKTGTKKYDNLVRNNHVVLVIFEPLSQTVAQVIGEAHELTNSGEVNDVAATICETSLESSPNGIIPIAKLDAGEYTAFRIEPKQIRMACYARPDSGDYNRIFESIESFELKP